jgi:putative transcriptional regulator
MIDLKGHFLVASQNMADPYFTRTVVLVLEHFEDGSYGVVVNRPSDKPADREFFGPIHDGGPIATVGVKPLLLHGHEERGAPDRLLSPGIWVGTGADWEYVCRTPRESLRCLVIDGYCEWGRGRLGQEINKLGVWRVVPAHGNTLWGVKPQDLWERLCPLVNYVRLN